MCKEFVCEYKDVDGKCKHHGNFTTYCLDTRCEGYMCCCLCEKNCKNFDKNRGI